MRAKLVLIIAIATVTLVLLSIKVIQNKKLSQLMEESEENLPVLTLAMQDNIFVTLPILAKQLGLYKANNLNIQIKTYPSGKLAFEAMIKGEADIATAAAIPFAINVIKQPDLKIISVIGYTDSAFKIIANKELGIFQPSQLQGKTIGVQLFSAIHFYLDVFLMINGIENVNVKYYQPDELVSALERGEVDAITMRNPYLMVAQKRLKEHIVEFSDNDIYRQYFFLIIKQQLMKRKNALESFMSALVEAEKFLYSRPNEALNLVENNFGPERNIEIRNDWEEYQFELLLGGGMLLSLEYELDWYYNKIGKRKESQINFLDFIETDVLMRLKPFSISVRK